MNWCWINLDGKIEIKVDLEDIEKIQSRQWYVVQGSSGKVKIFTNLLGGRSKRTITLGRFLTNAPEGKQVFNQNLDRFDFRKENLFVCSMKERQRMLGKYRPGQGSSRYRGVSFIKSVQLWRAAIEVNGKGINLGNYDCEHKAALAWNRAARKYFGPDAFQNQVA